MSKKFKDTKVGQFLIGKGGLFDALSNSIPDKGFLGVLKNLISKDDTLPPQDKETALKLLEIDSNEMQEVSKRWQADMSSDSWLSKNVRPLTLIFFSISYVIGWFLEYPLDSISGVLSIIIGAYFGSRGLEKYTKISKK
jgi:hypothetical protein|tara:strand:+ start:1878 stop:2294 length:417 start_codon:yes stop_codon:yes gene_type:complete